MERTAMHRVREILRLRWQVKLSVRQTAASAQVSRSVVSRTTTRAKTAGLTMAELETLDDEALSRRLYGARAAPTTGRAEPDPVQMHVELKRPGVTLELLHLEYLREHPEGYQYTAFCERYRRWKKSRPRSMRQRHVAGEKAFVDYSGKRPHYVDPEDGRRVEVELFVGTLGASNLTFVEASATQRLPDWIASHERMYAFFGGVSRVTRAGSATQRRDEARLVRAGDQSDVRIVRVALRDERLSGAARQAEGQGEGRGRGAGRAAMGPRAAAQ